MGWYYASHSDGSLDDYCQYENDNDAIEGLTTYAEWVKSPLLEIWECDDDECLTPKRLVWH